MNWLTMSRVAGALMLLLVVGLVLGFIFAQTPDASREDIAEDLADVADDDVVYGIGQAVQIAVGFLVAILGATLFSGLRLRNHWLASIGLVGFVGLGIMFCASSAAYVTLNDLANDLEEGGAGGAGEAEVLEVARAMTILGDGFFFLGISFFAIGLLGFGLLMAVGPQIAAVGVSPQGVRAAVLSPPTWLGWVAVAAGVLYLVGWLFLVSEWFFILVAVAFLLTLIWYLAGGIWYLFMAPELAEEVAGGGAPAE
ncbi:MAG TPA: DUF4386 family protein [Dehalococcoidia bacterium]|nr:DUF4386 family protein [Dehalococcoidia bacterium]